MSLFKGAMWIIFCLFIAIVLWALNVVYVDNAVPQILTDFDATFGDSSMGSFNPTNWAQLFIALIRYSPLFMIALGILGFVLEISIFGNSNRSGYRGY